MDSTPTPAFSRYSSPGGAGTWRRHDHRSRPGRAAAPAARDDHRGPVPVPEPARTSSQTDDHAEDPGRGPLQQRLAAVRAILQARARTQDAASSAVRPLPPGTYHLTARIFTGLFTDYDLRHNVTSGYVALPKGTPMFTGTSLGEVARQISTASGYEHPDSAGG